VVAVLISAASFYMSFFYNGRFGRSPVNVEWLVGALKQIKVQGGIGHLQDIRFGARGTTKRRALGAFNVQQIATELVDRGLLRKSSKVRDTYYITEEGRSFLDEHGSGPG
jgi:hypothetical protein